MARPRLPCRIARCNKPLTHRRGHPGAPPGNRDSSHARKGLGMPLGNREGTVRSTAATCVCASRRQSPRLSIATEICPNPVNEPAARSRSGQGSGQGSGQRPGRRQGGSGHGGHTRISHAWMRSVRPRKKYSRHEQIPTPCDGHSCGGRPSPQTTPISGPFPGDCDTWVIVSGPLTGDIGRGPDTHAHDPGGTPPNSPGKSALSRCVVGWVESGYVKRGAYDTRHLSSCLVTPTTISHLITRGRDGR